MRGFCGEGQRNHLRGNESGEKTQERNRSKRPNCRSALQTASQKRQKHKNLVLSGLGKSRRAEPAANLMIPDRSSEMNIYALSQPQNSGPGHRSQETWLGAYWNDATANC